MKKHWIIALIIIGLGAAGSAALWLWQAAPCTSDWLARELQLTPAQRAQLASLGTEFTGKCDSHCADLCAARAALGQELQRADRITPKVEELLGRMQAAQAASERETVQHLFRIKSVLTPEQQRRYIELVSGKLCGQCPRGVHHHGTQEPEQTGRAAPSH
ncbi:MAG: periplasmic heavy metal sensor [Verrucomicrobia bacterium]|nr:periplasmic heavy metal sensor [Verrucomicrobiota bacterium]